MKNTLVVMALALSIWTQPTYASPLEKASKYTARIKSTVSHAFAVEEAGTSDGAGFLVDKKQGWLLTNAHVSGYGTGDIEVSFKGSDYFEAKPIYIDPELDLALVKVPLENIPSDAVEAKLDCSDRILNGVAVAAFGHPHGLTYSSSRGIISQVRFYRGADWVQTDAAINPGNSGGPLIDINTGDVVGINAKGLEDTEGLNFALPMKPICKILELLSADKNPSPPKLPMRFAVNRETEEYLIVASATGKALPDGIELGDRIIKVNGINISTPTELNTYLRGKTGIADVVLDRSGQQVKALLPFSQEPKILDRKYVLADGALITEDIYQERWELEGFYHVHSVRSGSYAERSGWTRYRLIISIDGVRPTSLEHLRKLLVGEDNKTIIFRGWSPQEKKMNDYHEVEYWPYDVKLKSVGE